MGIRRVEISLAWESMALHDINNICVSPSWILDHVTVASPTGLHMKCVCELANEFGMLKSVQSNNLGICTSTLGELNFGMIDMCSS